jgi:16S rRNA (cytosine1402-N4)-methyltransferase
LIGSGQQDPSIEHVPVLADILPKLISLPTDGAVVDATVGHGGHSYLFGKQLGSDGLILGLDVDKNCIGRAQEKLSSLSCKVVLVRENFSEVAEVMAGKGIGKVDFILADLGFCSGQLTDSAKGLSFQENMPLDMRLDNRLNITAADIVNNEDEEDLANLIFDYGEERASRRIARFIVEFRRGQPITTTAQLAAIICKSLNQPVRGRRHQKVHPATKTFQALRIAVNDELGRLGKLLADSPRLLKQNGYIGIISFHSLEDRIVKLNFKENAAKGFYEIITKKPIVPLREEVISNPRARSSKLRIARRI